MTRPPCLYNSAQSGLWSHDDHRMIMMRATPPARATMGAPTLRPRATTGFSFRPARAPAGGVATVSRGICHFDCIRSTMTCLVSDPSFHPEVRWDLVFTPYSAGFSGLVEFSANL